MRQEYFSYSEEFDPKIEDLVSELLGVEKFEPEEGRLEKFFQNFRKSFSNKNIPIVIIGGTNGKGEVSLLLEDFLLQAGYQTFLWTSPHILTVRERFSIEGRPIDCLRYIENFERNKDLTKKLSFYEFLFYQFCEFVEELVDCSKKPVILLEVGLGGRLDATNFFDSELSVITNIGRDHLEFLGPTLKDVLKEKIEITRNGKPLVSGIQQAFLRENVKKYCEQKGVNLIEVDSPIESTFKELNMALAKSAFKEFTRERERNALRPIVPAKLWARPFEVTYGKGEFILLGSHNLDGLRHLANWVNHQAVPNSESSCSQYDEVWIGLSRKDFGEIKNILLLIQSSPCLGKTLRFFPFNHPRATGIDLINKVWKEIDQGKGRPTFFEDDWRSLLDVVGEGQKVLVAGSYYFISEILRSSFLRPLI